MKNKLPAFISKRLVDSGIYYTFKVAGGERIEVGGCAAWTQAQAQLFVAKRNDLAKAFAAVMSSDNFISQSYRAQFGG